MQTMEMTMSESALQDLDFHWGEAYDLAVTCAGWVAKRLDNGRALLAIGPDSLRQQIRADYSAEPVRRDLPMRTAGQA
jgi:hypothetical protein